MNTTRRKELDRALAMLEEARSIIDNVKDEEQSAMDNMPESLQEGLQGEKMQECISAMEDIDSSLDEAIGRIDEAKGT